MPPNYNNIDKDLSTEERFSKRRIQTARPSHVDQDRIFGTPSIRKDIPVPYKKIEDKSLTNPNVIIKLI